MIQKLICQSTLERLSYYVDPHFMTSHHLSYHIRSTALMPSHTREAEKIGRMQAELFSCLHSSRCALVALVEQLS